MQELGLSVTMAMKLYKLYGDDCVQKVRENPYRLIDDVENIGFKTADSIAQEAGYEYESEFRIKAGIKYTLSLARQEGNTSLPRNVLIDFAAKRVLNVEPSVIEPVLESMILSSRLRELLMGETTYIFLPYMHYQESECAVLLNSLVHSVELLPLFDVVGG